MYKHINIGIEGGFWALGVIIGENVIQSFGSVFLRMVAIGIVLLFCKKRKKIKH